MTFTFCALPYVATTCMWIHSLLKKEVEGGIREGRERVWGKERRKKRKQDKEKERERGEGEEERNCVCIPL